jgi:hypothetical protein
MDRMRLALLPAASLVCHVDSWRPWRLEIRFIACVAVSALASFAFLSDLDWNVGGRFRKLLRRCGASGGASPLMSAVASATAPASEPTCGSIP